MNNINNKNVKNFTPLQASLADRGGVTSGSKELEPSGSPFERITYHETQEHEPSQETARYIENRQETIKIDKDLEKLGVQSIKSTRYASYKEIKLPISDEKIAEGLKEPVDSSFRWLAELALSILKKAHATLKKIHGKIMRVATA